MKKHAAHPPANRSASRPANRPVNRPGVNSSAPIRCPEKRPLLDAICKKFNQRVDLNDEQRVLGLYERGWILNGVVAKMSEAEARYVRALANRHDSWIARQVA